MENTGKPMILLQYRPKVPGSMGTFSDWVDYDPACYAVSPHERHLAEEHAKELTEGSEHYEFCVRPDSVSLLKRHYLCNLEGLVDPVIMAGPFIEKMPDEPIIEALRIIDEEKDLLFGLTLVCVNGETAPHLWSFTNATMDELRERASVK